MAHTSLVSSIILLLWRMFRFIPASRMLFPPAVPKYNTQSTYSVHPWVRLRSFWSQAVSAIKWSLQHLRNLFKQPQRSLVSSSNFFPSWLRTQQGLSWMSSRPWAVQGKPVLINRRDPLWSKEPGDPQDWKPSTCSWNSIPQKFKASF